MVLLEVSFYIQSSEKKTKFHSRFETPIEADCRATALDLKRHLVSRMADKNVITGNPELPRLFVRLPSGDGTHTLADDDIIGNSRHLEAVYKTYGSTKTWEDEQKKITQRSYDASASMDGLVALAFIQPYQADVSAVDAEKTIFRVSETMSIGMVVEKAKQVFYQASRGKQPSFITCGIPFGPPTGYNEDHLMQMSLDDVERLTSRVREEVQQQVETAREEAYHAGYACGRLEASVASPSQETTQVEPSQSQSGYTAFAGQGMKLGEVIEEDYGNTMDDKGKVIEEVHGNTAGGEWETDQGMLFELNEKTSDDMKHCVISVNGNPFYKFYYQRGDRFNVLFTHLDKAGMKTNHIYKEDADYVLGFTNSFAHEFDMIENWGDSGACFILTDRKEQLMKMASSSSSSTSRR